MRMIKSKDCTILGTPCFPNILPNEPVSFHDVNMLNIDDYWKSKLFEKFFAAEELEEYLPAMIALQLDYTALRDCIGLFKAYLQALKRNAELQSGYTPITSALYMSLLHVGYPENLAHVLCDAISCYALKELALPEPERNMRGVEILAKAYLLPHQSV